ncbi:MAG: flagellar hook-basal body complex protein FliE [Nitrospiraceae bacterium]|nr:flagellar hook-basal body complex protein FliE [Nitrospiraceae bacterium]
MNNILIQGDSINLNPQNETNRTTKNKVSFANLLKDKVQEINKLQLDADDAISKVELKDSGSIHEAMIALEKASISFRTMMQVRNKILDAYKEVMRMQV